MQSGKLFISIIFFISVFQLRCPMGIPNEFVDDILNASYLAPLATGQTQCWDTAGAVETCSGTGQDGEYQKGRAADFTGPTQYQATGEYTTTDNGTGLVWTTCVEGQSGVDCTGGADTTYIWTAASTQCNALNALNAGAGYGGRTNWQMPTIQELGTIVDYSEYSPAVNIAYFPNIVAVSWDWSSTTDPTDTLNAMVVFPSTGWTSSEVKGNSRNLRCVSGSYDSSNDYLDMSDGTVFDKSTNLLWQKCSAGLSGSNCTSGTIKVVTWTAGLSYCNSLSLNGYTWKLPNINELKSIVDYTNANPAIDQSAFPNTASGLYMTSTTLNVTNFTQEWYIDMTNGLVNYDAKSNIKRVRCVTDGFY
ncbi:MAG: DUF1566 domain-containing protein [Leptospirales bacterium]